MVDATLTQRQMAMQSKTRRLLWWNHTSDNVRKHVPHRDLSASVSIQKFHVPAERPAALCRANFRAIVVEFNEDIAPKCGSVPKEGEQWSGKME
jgi:hypothetical protein